MEAILKFNLPEEESEFKTSVNAIKYYTALWDMDQWLRSETKYNDNLTESEYLIYETVRIKLHDIMMDNEVKF